MSLHILTEKLWFPPVEEALSDGLLAIGGDLSVERIILAYRNGIFPWYDGDIPLWWATDPRFVLFPLNIKVSKSMQSVFRKRIFQFTYNQYFSEVIENCKNITRTDQEGTWITDEIQKAYNNLNRLGMAISGEAWDGNQLVGGLYGVKIGQIFFGESMFNKVSNASKFAFISLIEELKKQNVQLIDCQVHTKHLESLGAEMIPRKRFQQLLQKWI